MMDSSALPFQLPVLALGQIAAEIVDQPVAGEVKAVFGSTFYLRLCDRLRGDRRSGDRQSDGLYLCLGHVEVEPGPLNCITAAPAGTDWRASGVIRGMKAGISSGAIRVGSNFRFPLTDSSLPASTRYQPALAACPEVHRLSAGVTAFRQAARRYPGIDGLGSFLDPEYQPPGNQYPCLAASGLLVDARRWLATGMRSPQPVCRQKTEWIAKLSGLGPGLTPSGDDFLGGVMIALHHLGERRLNSVLWPLIQYHVRRNSNSISLAHLAAASQGLPCAAIECALTAIATGSSKRIEKAMDGIARIGHTSGWDIMTGIVTTLEVWLLQQSPPGIH